MFSSARAQVECSRTKSLPVCGMNGETFESHCHAENLRVAVDYSGPCTAIPVSGRTPVFECLLHHDNCTNSKSSISHSIDSQLWALCMAFAIGQSLDFCTWCLNSLVFCIIAFLFPASDGISCPGVRCPPLPHPGCTGVTSRDACCRKCGKTQMVVHQIANLSCYLSLSFQGPTWPSWLIRTIFTGTSMLLGIVPSPPLILSRDSGTTLVQ